MYEITHVTSDLWKYYEVGNSSNKFSYRFPIGLDCTTVTEDMILIIIFGRMIKLTVDTPGYTFDIYRKLFTLDEYSVSSDVHNTSFNVVVLLVELRTNNLETTPSARFPFGSEKLTLAAAEIKG